MGIRFCVWYLCLLTHFIFKISRFARVVGKHNNRHSVYFGCDIV